MSAPRAVAAELARPTGLALLIIATLACGNDGSRTDIADAENDTAPDIASDTAPDIAGDSATDTSDAAADASDTGPSAPWYPGAVMYEIFVRSFRDSDGDGIGDLRGIIERLDYLNDGVPGSGDDLEVDGIWLMPIFASDSYHGYDVTDYRAIEPDYGDDADFAALVSALDERKMKLVLDLVMNHSGSGHPWFLASRSGPADPKRNWYVWRADDPGWKQPFGNGNVWHRYGGSYYYGVFFSGMPDLNYREPAVVGEMTDVARSWLGRGAAGFRLDAARYLVESADGALFEQPETHAFWRGLRAELGADAYLVGEVWTNRTAVTTYWGEGEELHQAFDFDLQGALLASAVQNRASWIVAELGRQKAAGAPWSYEATFLSNHDLDRLALELDDGEQRAAAFMLLTLPGTPYLYYGDELGAKSAPRLGDEAKRGPMAWSVESGHGFTSGSPWIGFADASETRNVATALADPQSLLRLYQALIRLRHAHPALAGGEVVTVAQTEPGFLVMLRRAGPAAGEGQSGGEVLLVALNLGAAELEAPPVDLSAAIGWLGQAPWTMEKLFGSTLLGSTRLGGTGAVGVTDPSAVPTGERWAPFEGRIWQLARGAGE